MADGAAKSCFDRDNPCTEEDLTPGESDPTKKLKKIKCTEPPAGKDSVTGGGKRIYNTDGTLTTDGNKQIDDILKTMGMDQKCTQITKNQVTKDVFNVAAAAKSSAFGMIELGVAMQAQNLKTKIDKGTMQQGCTGVAAQFSDITNAYSNLSCKMQKNKSTTNVQSVVGATIVIKGCMGSISKNPTTGKLETEDKLPPVDEGGGPATITGMSEIEAKELSDRLSSKIAPKTPGSSSTSTSTLPRPIAAYGQVFTWDTTKKSYVSSSEKLAETIRSNLAIVSAKDVQLLPVSSCANFPTAESASACTKYVTDYNINAQKSKTDNIKSFNDTLQEIAAGCKTKIKNSTLKASATTSVKIEDSIDAEQEVDTTTELKAITQAATEAKVKNKLGVDAITPKTKQLINSKINNSYNNASVTSLDNEMNKSVAVKSQGQILLYFAGPVDLDGVTIDANALSEIDLKAKLVSATKTAESIATELALTARTSTSEDNTVAGMDDLVKALGDMTAKEMSAIQKGNNDMVNSVMTGVSSENPLKYLGLMMLIVPVILILLVMFLMGGGKKAAGGGGGGGRAYPPPRGPPGYYMRFGGGAFKWILILVLLGVLVWLGLATAYEWWPFQCKLNIKNLWKKPQLCTPAASPRPSKAPSPAPSGGVQYRDLRREREHGLEFSRVSPEDEEPRNDPFEARRIVKNHPKNTQSYNKNVTFNLH